MILYITVINRDLLRIIGMTEKEIITLFREDDREAVRREIMRGASAGVISGRPVLWHGTLPQQDAVLLASFSFLSEETATAFYVSALEASLDGFGIVSEADGIGMSSVLRGAEDGEGRFHLVTAEGISVYRRNHPERMRRVLLTGGSIIATTASGYDARGARELASYLSSSAIAALGRYHSDAEPVISMADSGKDAAILRASLETAPGRKLAKEGCPVTDSFSSFRSQPEHIVYQSPAGRWSFGGKRYDAAVLR